MATGSLSFADMSFDNDAIRAWLLNSDDSLGSYSDPGSVARGWPLTSLKSGVGLSLFYLFAVFMGNRLMLHREPFKLKILATVHNLFLFALSLYMCIETLRQGYIAFDWKDNFNVFCPPLKTDPSLPGVKELATVLWIHYLSKVYEFVDTAIMILKKNTRQITFLHLYHHALTFFPFWWVPINYGAGGPVYLPCAVNSFIHIWMYAYYLMAGLGIRLTLLKPFITYGQMAQFIFLTSQAIYGIQAGCYRPKITPLMQATHGVILFIFFSNFAFQAYWKPKKKKKAM